MKTIALIITLIGLNLSVVAQDRPKGEKLSVEQQNQLQLKKMTLEYDLTTSQQKELAPILAEQNSKRKARKDEMKANRENKKQLSANERFEMKNKLLDEQIEFKSKMKKVLTKEQFEKWEDNRHMKMKSIKHRMQSRQNKNHMEDSK